MQSHVDYAIHVACAPKVLAKPACLIHAFKYPNLYIQVLHFKRVLLNVVAPLLNILTHQNGKQIVGIAGLIPSHLQQSAPRGIHGGVPQLNGLHFAQTFEAFHLNAAATNFMQFLQD